MRKNIYKLKRVAYWVTIVLLIIVVGVFVSTILDLPGGVKLFTVQSGSMAPAIRIGSLVIVKNQEDYVPGEIITYMSERKEENKTYRFSTTHRVQKVIVDEGETKYITRGDANDVEDPFPISKNLVVGKALFSIPLLGYPVAFAKTQAGFILLIVIPATIIIWGELMNIKNEAKRLLEERKRRKLSLAEKVEVEIGEEEIKAESWFKRFIKRFKKK